MDGLVTYHVSPRGRGGRGWTVEVEDGAENEGPWYDKESAVRYGRERARSRRGRLVVHRDDGSVLAEHGY